jgi:PhnB protein
MKSTINPYLFYSGRCEEALHFYEAKLGAQLEMMMYFHQSPSPMPPGMLQEGFENKVMHASFMLLGNRIMASDGCDDQSRFSGFRLAISVPSEDDAHRVFDGLAEGGSIEMPLAKTFWSPCYGMVSDRFQVGWMVMVLGDSSVQ